MPIVLGIAEKSHKLLLIDDLRRRNFGYLALVIRATAHKIVRHSDEFVRYSNEFSGLGALRHRSGESQRSTLLAVLGK
jgi:hypothetical protein